MPTRILVVDDDPMIVRLCKVNFELEKYEVVEAADGKEALAAVAAQKPDLMVCDVMMPHLNGLEVVARLRKDPDHRDLPIILLSAKAQERDIQQGTAAGADRYLTKPFDPDELLKVVEELLEERAKGGS